MVTGPVLAPGSDTKAPGDSEKPVDLPASAPQISSPVTHEKLEVQTALADPTRASDTRPADALTMFGASWRYAYTLRGVGSAQYLIDVRVTGVGSGIVHESITSPAFAERLVAVDMDSLSFRSIQLPQSQTLVELAPYLHSVLAKKETRIWGNLAGYPAGNPVLPPWIITVRESDLEEVTVPAGTFTAKRIEVSGRRPMSGSIPFHLNYESARFLFRAWYAPEVRRYVRLQHETWSLNGTWSGEQLVELTSYRAN
jgi:hypothetical protein